MAVEEVTLASSSSTSQEPMSSSSKNISSQEPFSLSSKGLSSQEPMTSPSKDLSSSSKDLSLQEPAKKRLKVLWRCVNPHCGSRMREELLPAPTFVVKCFEADVKAETRYKVCTACHDAAVDLKNDVKHDLMSNKLGVIDTSSLTQVVDATVVTLDDSDEDELESVSDHSDLECDFEPTDTFISSIVDKLDLANSIQSSIDDLERRLDEQEQEKEIDQMCLDVQKRIDEIRSEIYEPFRPETRELAMINISSLGRATMGFHANFSSLGNKTSSSSSSSSSSNNASASKSRDEIVPKVTSRFALTIGSTALASKTDILDKWELGRVTEIIRQQDDTLCYKMSFGGKRKNSKRILKAKQVAYVEEPSTKLSVGTRVLAAFRDPMNPNAFNSSDIKDLAFYPAVIGEPLKVLNNYRYLIFFDDGYTCYAPHQDVRLVCSQSKDVWEDVHPNSRSFIEKYLVQYPERPMVRLAVGQTIKTEWQGTWYATKVAEVDASLVKLLFLNDNRTELVYRGSTRLLPLFYELTKQHKLSSAHKNVGHQQGHARRHGGSGLRNVPIVEYTRQLDQQIAVARKSTSISSLRAKIGGNKHFQVGQIRPECRGEAKPVSLDTRLRGVSFKPHTCNPECVQSFELNSPPRGTNPLLIPILLGWDRQFARHRNNTRRLLYYVTPCGRRLRNMKEIAIYLQVTQSKLEIDYFTMASDISVLNEFVPEKVLQEVKDLSYGNESVPVPAVNTLNTEMPPYVEYSRERLPQEGVHINTSSDFLITCDCTDGCSDASKCSCRQLTVQSSNANADNVINEKAGYEHRRLLEPVPTGIYECNPFCKCCETLCQNRVAQRPLRNKLQVFKTTKTGWGLRTLCDMPRGSFVCIYVGNLYTNKEANMKGEAEGDEYFAELDHIETMESTKEGYESDVEEDFEDQVKHESPEKSAGTTKQSVLGDSDSDEEWNSSGLLQVLPIAARGERTRKAKSSSTESASSNTESPKESCSSASEETGSSFVKTRKLFGLTEEVYIMDAKSIGNLGRYMNHCCEPNVFVQNCYVDTHDLRFPWVAFFTLRNVQAGEELRWDYNYIVDQVQGKEMYCECGAETCRGRLL